MHSPSAGISQADTHPSLLRCSSSHRRKERKKKNWLLQKWKSESFHVRIFRTITSWMKSFATNANCARTIIIMGKMNSLYQLSNITIFANICQHYFSKYQMSINSHVTFGLLFWKDYAFQLVVVETGVKDHSVTLLSVTFPCLTQLKPRDHSFYC